MNNKKRITIFGWASFLNDLGSDIIFPVWPLFVRSLGASMSALGFIDGLGQALVSISQAFSGYLSDRVGKRKIFIWIGYLMGSIARVGYAFSTHWWHLIPFKALDRTGKIRSAPRDALVAESSSNYNRGRNFGFLRMMDNLGAVSGIIVCILFFEILGYRKLFLLAAIPSLIAVILILFFIVENPRPAVKTAFRFSVKKLTPNLKLFFIVSMIFYLGSFSYSFLIIFAKEHGFKTGFIPVLYLLFTVIASVVSLPVGRLSDKVGRKSILIIGYLFWVGVSLIFVSLDTKWAIILGFVFYGLHKGTVDPIQRVFVAELAPDKYRASILGVFQMLIGLTALFASFLAGILWDKFGIFVPFYLSIILSLLSLVLLFRIQEAKFTL